MNDCKKVIKNKELYIPTWIKLFPIIDVTIPTKIPRLYDCGYDRVYKSTKIFERLGLVVKHTHGNRVFIKLTEKGEIMKESCINILKLCDVDPYIKLDDKYLKKLKDLVVL